MRNKDGVLDILGCLRVPLFFEFNLRDAGKIISGRKNYGDDRRNCADFRIVDKILNNTGYTAYEYLGWHAYIENRLDKIVTYHYNYVLSEDFLEEFLHFKKTRLHDICMKMDLSRRYYAAERSITRCPKKALDKIPGDYVRKLELCLEYTEDFKDSYALELLQELGLDIERRLSVTPEYLVACPRVRQRLKQNGGRNEFFISAFSPC